MKDAIFALSSLYLVYTGFVFILPVIVDKKEDYDVIRKYFPGEKFRLAMGFLGLVLAVFIFIFPKGKLVFIGDLLPFLMLVVNASLLMMGRIRMLKESDPTMLQKAERILGNLQIPIGFISLIIGILHVFFSGIPVL